MKSNDLDARKQRLDAQAAAMKKARARLRKNQRVQQTLRLQELGRRLEAAAGRQLSPDDATEMAKSWADLNSPAPFSASLRIAD